MAGKTIKRSPEVAPDMKLYRVVTETTDSLPETNQAHGMNMGHYERAIISVFPAGGANPTVQVLWWDSEANAFVQEHTPIQRAGVGVNVPYQFDVLSLGRIMFVAVTAGNAGGHTTKISVAGYNLDHTL